MGLIGDWLNSRRMEDPIQGTAYVVSVSSPPDHAASFNARFTLTVQAPGVAPYPLEHECMVSARKFQWPGATLPVTIDRNHQERLRIEWDAVPDSHDVAMQRAQSLAQSMGGAPPPPSPPPMPPQPGQSGQPGTAGTASSSSYQFTGGDPAQIVEQLLGGERGREAAEQVRKAMAGGWSGSRVIDLRGESANWSGADQEGDPIERIEKLAKLRDDGIVSQQEFEQAKRKLLREL